MNTFMQVATTALSQTVHACTIAAVNGAAFGGGAELASAADLRVGSSNARAAFVQARMGLCTGWGGTAALNRAVGRAAALHLLLSTAPHTSDDLHRLGWLSAIAPPSPQEPPQQRCTAQATQVAQAQWDDCVKRGSGPMLHAVAGPRASPSSESDADALAAVLREYSPESLSTAQLSESTENLVRFVAQQYALPPGSAALARAPKRILNSNDHLATEREEFGQLWRGEAHTAALAAANRP